MKININTTKRADFIEICKNIIGTDEVLEFTNATENFLNRALSLGLTVRTDIKKGKLFDMEVFDEPDGPWNYYG